MLDGCKGNNWCSLPFKDESSTLKVIKTSCSASVSVRCIAQSVLFFQFVENVTAGAHHRGGDRKKRVDR
jgi:hypothetical protein